MCGLIKKVLFLCCFLGSIRVFGQNTFTDETEGPYSLAQKLTAPCSTDRQKVKAIFDWIADNIAYNVGTRSNWRQKQVRYHSVAPDTSLDNKSLNEIVAYQVLRKRVAICNGYARLFKTLCDYAGIQAQVVTGYARTNDTRIGERFKTNHSWNAVQIDSTWHLLDVTWASGYINFADEFVKQYDGYYFLTPPDLFFRNHYPDNLQWSLLSNPPQLQELKHAPYQAAAFVKYGITSFLPQKGALEAAAGDTLHFTLTVADKENKINIVPEDFFDSTRQNDAAWAFLAPDSVQQDGLIKYTYIVPEGVSWLHLMYNNDVLLRYKINVHPQQITVMNKPEE